MKMVVCAEGTRMAPPASTVTMTYGAQGARLQGVFSAFNHWPLSGLVRVCEQSLSVDSAPRGLPMHKHKHTQTHSTLVLVLRPALFLDRPRSHILKMHNT